MQVLTIYICQFLALLFVACGAQQRFAQGTKRLIEEQVEKMEQQSRTVLEEQMVRFGRHSARQREEQEAKLEEQIKVLMEQQQEVSDKWPS